MKKKKCLIVLVVTVIVLALIIGIPVAINELYKMGPGYIIAWSGADMLSFYSTMVGTGATILALVITITYTWKQISRDTTLTNLLDQSVTINLDVTVLPHCWHSRL